MTDRGASGTVRTALFAALAAVVLVSLCGAGVAAESTETRSMQRNATGPQVAITNVSVTPDQPTTGELVEFRTTIRNAESSPQIVDVTDVYVREQGSSRDIARAEDIGTLTAGSQLQVPLTGSFDETGVKDLRVMVTALTETGTYVQLQYPVTVVVRESGLLLDVDAAPTTVDGERSVSVTVLNGRTDTFRNLELVASGTNLEFDAPRRLDAVFRGGETATYTYTATVADEGQSTADLSLSYTTPLGQRRTIERRTPLEPTAAAGASEHPQVALSVQNGLPGARRLVNVTVANGLDSDVRQLSVMASSSNASFAVSERVQSLLASNETATFNYPASVAENGRYPVTVTLSYTRDGVRRQVTEQFRPSFDAPQNPARITLTGVDATLRGGNLEISATASNVGSSAADGVVVSVGDESQAVRSADYFVGSVDPSDFSSFTLSTGVTGNLSTVPVQVSYVVDGARQSVTTEVPVQQTAVRQPDTGGGGGLPVVPIAVVVVIVAAIVVYRRRG